jgi:cyclophilin family peptidyl-prolyl cis-trans isomerase
LPYAGEVPDMQVNMRSAVGWFVVAAILSIGVLLLFQGQATARADSLAADTTTTVGEAESTSLPRLSVTLEQGGKFIIELSTDQAPLACERILTLVKDGFYNGCKFHRVESYLVQTGKREHEYPPVEGEMFSQKLRHVEGAVGMARLPHDYDSAATQFYIIKEEKLNFNGEYTLFGSVVEGMDVVRNIKKGNKIERISVLE